MTVSQNYTFAKLLELIPDYSQRNDAVFLDNVPHFIAMAENRLATEMKQQGFQCVVVGSFGAGNVMEKPAFWRETISLSYKVNGVMQNIFARSLEYVKQYWPNSGETAAPKFYADYNISNFYLAPTPDAAYPFELVYYARLDPLTEAHQENWMSLHAPQALLYAALLEAALYKKNTADIDKWTAQYREAVGGLLGENKERLGDRNSGVRPQ